MNNQFDDHTVDTHSGYGYEFMLSVHELDLYLAV